MLANLNGNPLPMLITLTGEPDTMGRGKKPRKKIKMSKWIRRGLKAVAFTAAPVLLAPAAAIELRKAMKRRKAGKKNKAARAAAAAATVSQIKANAAATENPTPENKAAAFTANIQAAQAKAAETAAEASPEAEPAPEAEASPEAEAATETETSPEAEATPEAAPEAESSEEETAGIGFNFGFKDEVFTLGAAKKKPAAAARPPANLPAIIPAPPKPENAALTWIKTNPGKAAAGTAAAILIVNMLMKHKKRR